MRPPEMGVHVHVSVRSRKTAAETKALSQLGNLGQVTYPLWISGHISIERSNSLSTNPKVGNETHVKQFRLCLTPDEWTMSFATDAIAFLIGVTKW